MTFYYASLEVSHAAYRVGLHLSLRVLHHNHAVLVVGVGDGEGRFGQHVEESLLRVAVVLESLVIVEMISCEIGEQTAGESESADALLRYGVRRTLHEGVLAACIHHAVKQFVQRYRVWRRVVCRHSLVNDVVAHGRKQSALMSHLREHII